MWERRKIAGILTKMLVCGIGVILWCCEPVQADTRLKVSDFKRLKQELERPGRSHIELAGNIRITAPVYVKGENIIEGKGHSLKRELSKNRTYGGSLFIINGGTLNVKETIISGGGRSRKQTGRVFGPLIEVRNGKFVLGKRGVLRDNINDRSATSGGGAVLVQRNGKFYMYGGEISGNKNVMGGAGVRIESQGKFIMTGGKISGNQSQGLGAVEGFDGRGGAIYNEGKVRISGGEIKNNRAKKFSDTQNEYGGVGGMLYNRGECWITGGIVSDNIASSGGGAIYTAKQSFLQITGGTIRGNKAVWGKDIFIAGGKCYLAGSPRIETIYLGKDQTVMAGERLRLRRSIVLIPERYEKGLCLVKGGKKKDFLLKKKGHFILCQRKNGLYIERTGDKVQSKGKPELKLKPKPKSKPGPGLKPQLRLNHNPLRFYVGEYVGREILCFGIAAADKRDGSLTKNVRISKIVYPDGEEEKSPARLDTSRAGEGSIYYQVTNSRGKRGRLRAAYRVIPNKKAVIQVSPRYLFVWEVQHYSLEKWVEVLLANCKIEDDCETRNELRRDLQIEWNGLLANKAGTYTVCLRVRDQQGHRYYMPHGKMRRYGRGKTSKVQIPVTLVGSSKDDKKTTEGYIRFLPETPIKAPEGEIWHFKREDIEKAKRYMKKQQNPFSAETNQNFLKIFQYCYIKKEEIPGGEE